MLMFCYRLNKLALPYATFHTFNDLSHVKTRIVTCTNASTYCQWLCSYHLRQKVTKVVMKCYKRSPRDVTC